MPARKTSRSCFNEAGAINPGKPAQRTSLYMPNGNAIASMRPGQLTPENLQAFEELPTTAAQTLGFNEAGAINPGKQVIIDIDTKGKIMLQ